VGFEAADLTVENLGKFEGLKRSRNGGDVMDGSLVLSTSFGRQ
jgi:hypothetical protein